MSISTPVPPSCLSSFEASLGVRQERELISRSLVRFAGSHTSIGIDCDSQFASQPASFSTCARRVSISGFELDKNRERSHRRSPDEGLASPLKGNDGSLASPPMRFISCHHWELLSPPPRIFYIRRPEKRARGWQRANRATHWLAANCARREHSLCKRYIIFFRC